MQGGRTPFDVSFCFIILFSLEPFSDDLFCISGRTHTSICMYRKRHLAFHISLNPHTVHRAEEHHLQAEDWELRLRQTLTQPLLKTGTQTPVTAAIMHLPPRQTLKDGEHLVALWAVMHGMLLHRLLKLTLHTLPITIPMRVGRSDSDALGWTWVRVALDQY